MQTSDAFPGGAVAAEDLADLANLLASGDPALTVHLGTEPATPQASQQNRLRWNALRARAESIGAPSAALAAVDEVVPEAHLDGPALTAIAAPDGLRHVEHADEPIARDVVRWGLPSVAPLIKKRQNRIPHAVVLADRHGADIRVVDREARLAELEVGGSEKPIHKVQSGGWSQRRWQQRVDEAWKENAGAVAEEVTRLVDRLDLRLVAAGGDVRALQLVVDALPGRVRDRWQEIDGGRASDGSSDAQATALTRALATVAARDTVELLQKFDEEHGQNDLAVTGAAPTLAALARSQVGVLLVHDDPDDEREVWFGPEPSQVSCEEAELRDLGIEPRPGRLTDAAIRAALGTGAAVRIVPGAGPLTDRIGALLRWS
jgi:hypothetical protein